MSQSVLVSAPSPRFVQRASEEAFSWAEVSAAQMLGAHIVDTRSPAQFAISHIRGSINAPLSPDFTDVVDAFVSRSDRLLVIAADDEVDEAIRALRAAGFTHVLGYLNQAESILREAPPGTIQGYSDLGVSTAKVPVTV